MKRFQSLREVQHQIQSGSISLPDLVQHYLLNIKQHAHLNAFVEVWPDEALERASSIQQKLEKGTAGKLAGMVLSLKDNLALQGKRMSAGSKMLESFHSIYTSTAIERLLKEDAILIGTTNCDEFAMGSSNENSAFGPALNPHDNTRVPGGSSGGSAVAVAADMCLASIGSDTGGSVRQPAALCGVWGFKPSYGCISRYGLTAYASSFDQIGPITQCAEDAALLTEIMSGPDGFDTGVVSFFENSGPRKVKRIGFFRECLDTEALNPSVKEATVAYLDECRKQGYEVKELSFDLLQFVVPAYYVLTAAEASSNLERFDGVHYGHRSNKATTLEEVYEMSRSEAFGWEVKRRIMMGTFVLSSDQFDKFYRQAQRVRSLIKSRIHDVFNECDILVMPCTTDVAFELGAKNADPVAMYMEDIYTVLANLAGIPALSIPLGKRGNLPFGIQLLSGAKEDKTLLDFARTMENQVFFQTD